MAWSGIIFKFFLASGAILFHKATCALFRARVYKRDKCFCLEWTVARLKFVYSSTWPAHNSAIYHWGDNTHGSNLGLMAFWDLTNRNTEISCVTYGLSEVVPINICSVSEQVDIYCACFSGTKTGMPSLSSYILCWVQAVCRQLLHHCYPRSHHTLFATVCESTPPLDLQVLNCSFLPPTEYQCHYNLQKQIISHASVHKNKY